MPTARAVRSTATNISVSEQRHAEAVIRLSLFLFLALFVCTSFSLSRLFSLFVPVRPVALFLVFHIHDFVNSERLQRVSKLVVDASLISKNRLTRERCQVSAM